MNKKVVIFDLDGTLIDSLKDIALATNEVLKNFGFKTYEIGEYKKFIGNGAKELVKNALPKDIEQKEIENALTMFKEIYSKKVGTNAKPFDGIYEMLEALEKEGFVFGLLSNKMHQFTLAYMQRLFKDYNFVHIQGQQDQFPRKPDPTSAIIMGQKFGVEPSKIYYVGDTVTDMQTAKGAGFIAVGVLWGYQDEMVLRNEGAKYTIKTPQELVEIIKNKV